MHIEPGVLDATKILLSYGTSTAAVLYGANLLRKEIREDAAGPIAGSLTLGLRSAVATLGTLVFFELLPHFPVGPSEVHFIFGTMLLLFLGAGASTVGLSLGLLLQALFLSPTDFPQFGANLTSLLVPLFATAALARRVTGGRRYVDLRYGDALKLSLSYQAGVVGWVAFWVMYGQGVTALSISSVATFAVAYAPVALLEPLVDVAALGIAKRFQGRSGGTDGRGSLFVPRLFQSATASN
ncbi:MAG: energy-coupling factor ABC transporter permease [Myxococcota bacterium]